MSFTFSNLDGDTTFQETFSLEIALSHTFGALISALAPFILSRAMSIPDFTTHPAFHTTFSATHFAFNGNTIAANPVGFSKEEFTKSLHT